MSEHSPLPYQPVPFTNLDETLDAIELAFIHQALILHDHNKTHAAKALGISTRSIHYRIAKLRPLIPPKRKRGHDD